MKKLYALVLAAVLLLSFGGCGTGSTDEANGTTDMPQNIATNTPTETQSPPTETLPPETETLPAPTHKAMKVLTDLSITRVDHLGNETTDNWTYFFKYDEQGRIIELNGDNVATAYGFANTWYETVNIVYASDGNIENVKLITNDSISALGTPMYDENGNIVSMHIQTNDKEFTLNFTYDENSNRLSADIFYDDRISYAFQYSYDAEGHLIKEVWEPIAGSLGNPRTIEYTYDNNGRLTQSSSVWVLWDGIIRHKTTVYSYDNDGDVIQTVATYDNTDLKTETIDYIYTYININP